MFLPVAPWWIVLIIILVMAYDIKKKRTIKSTLFEIKYESLSEKRKQKARDRADRRGFIYLGDAKRQLDTDLSWYMSSGKNVACRFDGDELGFYVIEDNTDFFNGTDCPKSLLCGVPISQIRHIQAWGRPGAASGAIRINIHPLPGSNCNFIEAQYSSYSEKNITDALILIRERTAAFMKV